MTEMPKSLEKTSMLVGIDHAMRCFAYMQSDPATTRVKRGRVMTQRQRDILRNSRDKEQLFKYAAKFNERMLSDEDRHIGPNQVGRNFPPRSNVKGQSRGLLANRGLLVRSEVFKVSQQV